MGWATKYIQMFSENKARELTFRVHGNSMTPRIKNGSRVTVVNILESPPPEVGDVVLCRVHGHEYLHLVSAKKEGQYQISNLKGRVNGWIKLHSIYGVLKEDD